MRRVNVVSSPQGDTQLQLLADRLAGEHQVTTLADVDAVLAGLGPEPDGAVLDLSGHSATGAGHLLRLGGTVISAGDAAVATFFHDRKQRLHDLGFRAIRLLGCCTASSDQGQQTIRLLAYLVGLPVYGTISLLSVRDYDPMGLLSDYARDYLVDQDHLATIPHCPLDPPPEAAIADPMDLQRLPVEPAIPQVAWRVTVLPPGADVSAVRAALGGKGFAVPGLLAAPDLTLLVATGASRWRRIDVLFSGRLIRVFPDQQPAGVLYRADRNAIAATARGESPRC